MNRSSETLPSQAAFIDESSHSSDEKFTVFGGLILPTDHLHDLRRGLSPIKLRTGHPLDKPIKYNSKDIGVPPAAYNRDLMYFEIADLLRRLGAKLFFNIVHGRIGKNDRNRSLNMNLQICISTLLDLLANNNSTAVLTLDVMKYVDRRKLELVFEKGVHFPRSITRPDGLASLSTAHVEFSPGLQALDMILGYFQRWINNPEGSPAELAAVQAIKPIIWGADDQSLIETGIKVRPLCLKSWTLAPTYSRVHDKIKSLAA